MALVTGRIARLSLAALRMAAEGSLTEPKDVARWLYSFGTAPRGPGIDRDFGPDDNTMAVLGLTAGGRVRRLLAASYEAHTFPGWYSFAWAKSPDQRPIACKLYVSPAPEALTDAFPIIAEQFVRSEVRSFKVGRGVEGLLRPDKIVAYFEDHAHLQDVANALDQSLQSFPAQGAPFTAEAGVDGLLSVGVDPPPLGTAATSWRSWVTKRLAISLTSPRAHEGLDRVGTTLEEIRLAGVDAVSWKPTSDISWKTDLP